jgi:hypothetical protein
MLQAGNGCAILWALKVVYLCTIKDGWQKITRKKKQAKDESATNRKANVISPRSIIELLTF